MTTKYTYPPGLTKSQKRAYRKRMRGGGQTTKASRPPKPQAMTSKLGIPTIPQDDVFDASIIAAVRSTDIVLAKHTECKTSGYITGYRRDGSVPFRIWLSGHVHEITKTGQIQARQAIKRETLRELIDMTFFAEPRGGNKNPWFLFIPGSKVGPLMVQAFEATRLPHIPPGLNRVKGVNPHA